MSAKDLFHRLQARYPHAFPASQLRTLQRRVKVWRANKAHQLIFAEPNREMPIGSGQKQGVTTTVE